MANNSKEGVLFWYWCFVWCSLTLGWSTINPDQESSLKPCMYIYTQNYVCYNFLRQQSIVCGFSGYLIPILLLFPVFCIYLHPLSKEPLFPISLVRLLVFCHYPLQSKKMQSSKGQSQWMHLQNTLAPQVQGTWKK